MKNETPPLTTLLEKSEIQLGKEKFYLIKDDAAILDYIIDCQDRDMLKKFQDREENAGIALFYHDRNQKRDLVYVIRYKGYDNPANNGLTCMVVKDVHKNPVGITVMKSTIAKCLADNPELKNNVISSIESFVTLAINQHSDAKEENS